ncbi:hypothetical protein L195_g046547 [Trifolium pratense]|uniref:Uncharacterized protein n=1 Tax=Trifolium pratense TaxID=57577 RepID=A0A2K3MI01_TRIPR|nr:hypothetical protein L195_g046547 [Trifolium pratense]
MKYERRSLESNDGATAAKDTKVTSVTPTSSVKNSRIICGLVPVVSWMSGAARVGRAQLTVKDFGNGRPSIKVSFNRIGTETKHRGKNSRMIVVSLNCAMRQMM